MSLDLPTPEISPGYVAILQGADTETLLRYKAEWLGYCAVCPDAGVISLVHRYLKAINEALTKSNSST